MEKIRINNDINLQLAVTRGGIAEDFTNLVGNINLILRHKYYKHVSIVPDSYTLSGNTISIYIPADLQRFNGEYILCFDYQLSGSTECVETHTWDAEAFELVNLVSEIGGENDSDIVSETIILSADTAVGAVYKGEKGDRGNDGLSAFEVWLLQDGNSGKTVEQFFATFGKGEQGETGQSAFELWLQQAGNSGKTESDFFATFGKGEDGADGENGLSAFQVWLNLDGNSGKTEQQFFDSIKGEKGDKGDVGATGAQGLQGEKGDKGDTGLQGVQGIQGEQGLQGVSGYSAFQSWTLLPGNSNKTITDFYTYLSTPATEAALAEVETFKLQVTDILNTSTVAGIVNTQENGFYITDSAGNVGLAFDESGLDVTDFKGNASLKIGEIAVAAPKTTIPVSNVLIYGDNFVTLNATPYTYTCLTLPLDCTDKRVNWKCDNGIIYGQDDKTCKIMFTSTGYTLISCYSLSDTTKYTTFRVNVLNSLSDTSVNLDYNFSNETPSDATGTIKLTSTSSGAGTYNLYWGDSNGIITGMSEMFALTCSGETLTASRTLVNGWMIPQAASRIYAKSASNVVYGFDLPTNKLWNSSILGNKLYSFGLISDSHCGTISSNTGYALTNDIPTALRYYNSQGCSFICGAGDITNSGSLDQLASLSTIINNTDYNANLLKVYTSKGNHDIQTSNDTQWVETFGYPKDLVIRHGDPSLTTFDGVLSADVYRLDVPETDIFVFQSVSNSYGTTPTNTSQQAKLTEIVNNNKDKRIFYFMHVPMYQTVGDPFSSYDLQDGLYPQAGTTYYNWFMNLMSNNKNVIFFNGHTHFCFEDALNDSNTVVYDGNGEYGWFVHIPSLGRLRKWKYGISYSVLDERGQGGIVDVYANHIVIRGRDLGTVNKDNINLYNILEHDVPAGQIILKNKK